MGTIKMLQQLEDIGYVNIGNIFSNREVSCIISKLNSYMNNKFPGTVYEQGGITVRGLHGLHLYDPFFYKLSCHPIFLDIAEQHLGSECYVHQFKVNLKRRMSGQSWPWHQDFIYWKSGDGIKLPTLVNIGILLDDVDMLCGPLCYIPSSHKNGDLTDVYNKSEHWNQDLSQNLTYQIGPDKIEMLLSNNKEEYMLGKAGDVIAFDPLLVHCSSTNMSPMDRKLLLITYNSPNNPPQLDSETRRPEFLCSQNYKALAASSTENIFAPDSKESLFYYETN